MRPPALCCALLLLASSRTAASAALPPDSAATPPAAAPSSGPAPSPGAAPFAAAQAGGAAAPSVAAPAGGAAAPSAAASTGGAAAPSAAASPVVDYVKAVPRRALLRGGRVELAPAVGVGVNDPFYTRLSLGGAIAYHIVDAVAVGIGAEALPLHAPTGAFAVARAALTSTPALYTLPALFAHADVYWLPAFGKIALLDATIATFDLYAAVGLGASMAPQTRSRLAGTFALGQHYTLAPWLALRLEVRDHVFVDGQNAMGIAQSSLQNYLLVNLGLSFYLPLDNDGGRS